MNEKFIMKRAQSWGHSGFARGMITIVMMFTLATSGA